MDSLGAAIDPPGDGACGLGHERIHPGRLVICSKGLGYRVLLAGNIIAGFRSPPLAWKNRTTGFSDGEAKHHLQRVAVVRVLIREFLLHSPPWAGMMPAMARIYDPAQLSHPRVREFAAGAAWIATLDEAANDLEDLLVDVPPEERVLPDYSTPWPWDFDAFVVALSVMNHTREAAEQGLEELVAT